MKLLFNANQMVDVKMKNIKVATNFQSNIVALKSSLISKLEKRCLELVKK
jgi:hypothetical protein